MDTICPGNWSRHFTHPTPVLVRAGDPANPEPGVSHGMCERCSLILEAEMNGLTGLPLVQYAAYLASPIDPRD